MPSCAGDRDHRASTQEMQAAEQKRWMLWFGIPALVAAVFVGMTFATGEAWWLGLAITAIVVDIFVLVWLAMTLRHERRSSAIPSRH